MKKKKPLLLIVDDVPRNIKLLGTILSEQGYNITMADNGPNALKILETVSPDLILLDIMMPEMDGLEVCRIIKEDDRLKEIPVIFLTAKSDTDDLLSGFEAGAADYVTKPFNTHELLARVETHLELKSQRDILQDLNKHLEEKVNERTAELVEANKRLEKLDDAKNYFLGLLSHELNTPLTGITGFTRLLQGMSDSDEHHEYCTNILESAERLQKFAKLSQLITRLRTQKYHVQREEVAISSLIDYALFQLDDKIKLKGIEVIKSYKDGCCGISVDPELIGQVIQIILDNAIKYSPSEGKIEFKILQENNSYIIEVIDEGPGFAQDALDSLFDLFTSDELMHHDEGLGLGLAAVKIIMDTHMAFVSARNIQPQGAAICLKFKR